MAAVDYLESILKDQELTDTSAEMKALDAERTKVESILNRKYAGTRFTFRQAGSRAKGTLIRDSYDLDLVFYVHADEKGAGETISAIYENVAGTLGAIYYIDRKTSAVRLRSKDAATYKKDFHIDVVPGRFVKGDDGDCFIHQNGGEKSMLKTNLDVHVRHVRNSGVLDAVRLLKLARARRGLQLKQFVWELLCIELLKGHKKASLDDQFLHVLSEIDKSAEAIRVVDPANEFGNDLTPVLQANWTAIRMFAQNILHQISAKGWSEVFGKPASAGLAKPAIITSAAAATAGSTKAWAP